MVYSYIESYSTVKGNEVLIQVIAWMLTERSQKKNHHVMRRFHIYKTPKIDNSIDTKRKLVLCGGGTLNGAGKVTVNGDEVSFRCDENCSKFTLG